MRKRILSFLLTAILAIVPAVVIGHERDGMMDDEMHPCVQERGMSCERMGPGEYGTGMGMTRGCGYGGRGMMGLGPIWMLDLTPDQRTKLNRIRYDLRKQDWALKGKMIDQEEKLSDLYAANRPDPKKIGAVYGAIFDLRRQMIEAQIDAMNRAHDLLTKEQQTKLQQFRQYRGMGTGGMMRREMMYDMMSGGTGTR